jgi:hypothetical protein
MMSADEIVAFQFMDAINAGSIESLADLMTEEHRFVDSAGSITIGKDACLAGWRRFFVAFPDYQNFVDRIGTYDGTVVIRGGSACSSPELDGPALWAAEVVDGLIDEWRVYDDTTQNRHLLGIGLVYAYGEVLPPA